MSPFIFDADLAVTKLGSRRRASITVAAATDDYAAQLIAEYLTALKDGRHEEMLLIRDQASAIHGLVDELDGFDYPAAA
jgi:hypothetical protein